MTCNFEDGKLCNYCNECFDYSKIQCRVCKFARKHDKHFGYCKLHMKQIKLDENCSEGIRKYQI